MEKLPRDVLPVIFIRLLAKQVAQMRCVCKSWNALLSESSFIKSHLNHSIHNNDRVLLFFEREFSFDRARFTARPCRSPHLKLTNFIKLPVHPLCKSSCGSVIGSVNGLICFCYRVYSCGIIVGIWNPSLSAVSPIPRCSLSSHEVHFAFGFDPKTDDYKVVKLPSFIRDMEPKAEVYSMIKGSWRTISRNFPSHIAMFQDRDVVFLDGHFHWVCKTNLEGNPDTILTFDLGAETFHEIRLPEFIVDYHGYRRNVLGVLSGKLCLMSSVRFGECEVWAMDEYGAAESWVKHHASSQFHNINPYRFTSHNEFLFQAGRSVRYNLSDLNAAKTKTFKINFGSPSYVHKITEYVDSLVWIPPTSRLQI